MILSIPILASLMMANHGQIPGIPLEPRTKPVIVALAEQETLSEQPRDTSLTEIESFLHVNGIKYWSFPDDNFTIIVSKQIAPIEDYLATAKWADSVRNSGQTTFSCDSPEGQQLFDALCKRQNMERIEVAPQEKFMALSATFSISDPSGTIGRPVFGSVSLPKKPLATVYWPPETDNDAAAAEHLRAKRRDAPFPLVMDLGTYKVTDFGTLKGTLLQAQALQSMSHFLEQLGRELEAAQRSAKAAVDSLVVQLADSAYGQEGSKNIKKANFNNLPPGVKDELAKMAKSNPEMLGFSNTEDATRFLDSNPMLEVKYHLAISTKSTASKDGKSGTTVTSIVLYGN
ncbi:MAG: hypothetical protein JNM28_03630 [Armatimonadetes bacterium]|nr:hypothetical protein [Armatimonadota bacterium]